MNKNKFLNYKPSINVKARGCLPEVGFNYFYCHGDNLYVGNL